MIILDAEESQSKQLQDALSGGITLRFPDKVAARSDSPLPDYETSEARQKLIVRSTSRKASDTKLWRAVLYSLVIYVILSVAIGVPIILVKKQKQPDTSINFGPISWDNNPAAGPSTTLSNSNTWTLDHSAKCGWDNIDSNGPPFSVAQVKHTFDYSGSFNIRSNISILTTNTSFSNGYLTVDINSDPSATKAIFEVEAFASTKDLLKHLSACFTDTGNDRGLLVYVSKELKNMDFISVNIHVLLPSKEPPPPYVENFITYLPGYTHNFGDLQNHLTIKNLVIEGGGYDVVVESVKATKISVKNSYASIIGGFYATASLSLDSIKGNIDTNITLEYLPTATTPTSLMLDTGDGAIDAQVVLVAPSRHSFPHNFAFIADVKTFNGPLTFQVTNTNSTPPVPLQLTVQNTDGKTEVSLDRYYEGAFNVQSKLGKVNLPSTYLPSSMDPLGQRRQRKCQFDQQSANVLVGWVGWGQRPSHNDGVCQGQVRITTSISPIMLSLASS